MKYRLCIYDHEELVCIIHGELNDITFIIENLKFKICYHFKITEL